MGHPMSREQRRAAKMSPCVLCGEPLAGDPNSVMGATWVCHGTHWREYVAKAEGRSDLARMTEDERLHSLRVGLTRIAGKLYDQHRRRQGLPPLRSPGARRNGRR